MFILVTMNDAALGDGYECAELIAELRTEVCRQPNTEVQSPCFLYMFLDLNHQRRVLTCFLGPIGAPVACIGCNQSIFVAVYITGDACEMSAYAVVAQTLRPP